MVLVILAVVLVVLEVVLVVLVVVVMVKNQVSSGGHGPHCFCARPAYSARPADSRSRPLPPSAVRSLNLNKDLQGAFY